MFGKQKRRSAGGQDDAFDLTIDGTILSKVGVSTTHDSQPASESSVCENKAPMPFQSETSIFHRAADESASGV